MLRVLCVLAVVAGIALASAMGRATAQEAAKEQPKPATKDAAAEGIHLIAAAKRFYFPYHGPRERYDATGFFHVLKDGKEPEDGYFEFQGKPVLVTWKANNRRVVEIQQDRAGHRIAFLASGKATLTVSAGPWSDRAAIEVVVVPFAPDMPVSTFLKKYGPPKRKSASPPSALQWNERPGVTEYWEYDKWPGCVIGMGSDKVLGILTVLPPTKDSADQKAEPGKPAAAPGAVMPAPGGR